MVTAGCRAFVSVGFLLALALVGCGGDGPSLRAAEVDALRDCPAPRCVSRQEAARELGFTIWEPTALPDGYEIYERAVLSPRIGQSPPGTDPSQSSPGEPAPTRPSGALPKSLSLVYRFNQSLNVPPLLVNETALAEPGARISLSLRGPSCGEVIGEDAGGTIYINGLAEIEMGESETDWLVCKVDEVPARDSHTVFLTRGHVLIEVVAFADAGVSREEVIRLAGSFVEAK